MEIYLSAINDFAIGVDTILGAFNLMPLFDTFLHPLLSGSKTVECFALVGSVVIDDTLCHVFYFLGKGALK